MQGNLLPHDGEMYLFDRFFEAESADRYLLRLKEMPGWKQEPIRMFGKQVLQPRLTAFCGINDTSYAYSGIRMHPQPMTDELLSILQKIEQFSQLSFTHVLLNWYRNGADSMGWHRDNEASLGTDPAIASVSFGEPRTFQVRCKKNPSERLSLILPHGSLLLMKGAMQTHWEHCLPKTRRSTGDRINLTFRKVF
ncbi:alpha-ketoglutarate-dependent dioxygenase AlkB [Cyclobacterium xiamenense]|uniref:alpha-ketoglutarate-dependent dioxygenase AlkB family protein n=1 Tax=Cyclobacterium xiamenense TaxID=1297121 RepID=UPI0035CEA72C